MRVAGPAGQVAAWIQRRADRWRQAISVGGTLAATLGTFVFFAVQGVVLARMLGPEGRGAFAATVAYPQMLLYLGLLGAADLFARRGAQLAAGDARGDAALRRGAALYGGLTGLVTLSACAGLIVLAMPAEKRSLIPLALLAACSVPLQHIRFSVQAVDHGRGDWTRYNLSRILAAAAPPLLLLAIWGSGLGGVRAAVIGYLAAMLAALPLCHWGMGDRWWGPVQPRPLTALREGRGFAASQVAAELLDRADILLILWLGTLAEQGWYASAVPVAATMTILPMAVAAYTFRHGAVDGRPLTARQVTGNLGGLIAAQLALGSVLAACLPYLIPLLLGSAFEATVGFAWLLLPAAGLRGVVIAADGYLRGRGRSRPGTLARLAGLILMLSLSLALHGAIGAAAIPVSLGVAQAVCLAVVAAAIYREAIHREASAAGATPL